MTEQHQPGLASQAVRFVLDVANRRHALSKLVPFVLFVADAVLCALIIWKIPCMFVPPCNCRRYHHTRASKQAWTPRVNLGEGWC